MNPDRLRVWLNLLLAPAMTAVTTLCFYLDADFRGSPLGEEASEHVVTPAGYAFSIWSLIYLGAVTYAVVQALPSRRTGPLYRGIGWWTASAFLGVCVWLVLARFGLVWATVACIVWILASLAPVLWRVSRADASAAEWVFVVFPLSVFAGWVTVATFANAAAGLKVSGWENVGLAEPAWAAAFVVAAGLIGAAVTLRTGGNLGFAATVVWAFVAIAARNRTAHPGVAATAVAMSAVVVAALVYARLPTRQPAVAPTA
jgi:hypothetical protein